MLQPGQESDPPDLVALPVVCELTCSWPSRDPPTFPSVANGETESVTRAVGKSYPPVFGAQ